MTEIATILWWWLPTKAIAEALAGRLPNPAQRWPIALAAWVGATGAFGTAALTLGVSLRGIRFAAVVVLLSAAAFVYWRRRQTHKGAPNFERLSEKTAPFAPQVFSLVTLVALLLISGTLAWSVLGASAGSSEFFAYSTSARSAVLEGGATQNLYNGALHSILGERIVAFPVAVQYITAAITGTWSLWPAKLPYVLIWFAALTLALSRLREAKLPLAASVLLLLLILLIPSLVTLVGRGSDLAWIAGCALAASSGWLSPRRSGVSLAFSAIAFLWNPWLGWPLALVSAAFAIAVSANPKWRDRVIYLLLGSAFVLVMLVLQSETFLPQAIGLWFRPALQTPLWGQHPLWQAVAIAGCAAAIAVVLLSFGRSRSSLALKWYVGFALLTIIASLRTMQEILGATDSALDLALVLFTPALLMVSLSAVGQHVFALSDYQPGTQAVREAIGEDAGVTAPQTAADLVAQPALDHQQMRDKLILAYEQFGLGNLSGSAATASEVLQYDANHPDAHHLLALVALQENRPGDALRAVHRAIDVYPEHALFFLTVAEIYGKQERWAEQADALSTASKLDPSDISTKTKLVIAKRKALVAQAQAQAKLAESGSGEGGYEIQVATPPKRL
jgi:tetratricopeptide (TPR) repeat protein